MLFANSGLGYFDTKISDHLLEGNELKGWMLQGGQYGPNIGSGSAILTKSENASNLIRALAYGWRYRKAYEAGTPTREIEKTEKVGRRTVYKYLALGYKRL